MTNAYVKFANKKGFETEYLTDETGHVILKISGKNVWDSFKNESGKHVVQRIPPTERNGRTQTSIITVVVLELPPEKSIQPLNDKDLQVIRQTGKQGAGGQNCNRVASAIRIFHLPTGLSVFINGRDQSRNYYMAITILTTRVNNLLNSKVQENYDSDRRNKMTSDSDTIGGRGNKIRTYNFIRGDVTDHNLNLQSKNLKAFMKGDFSVLFG